MLYLVGGAARSGKTIIAQRLLREKGVPCFCVDYFVSGLQQGAPGLGIVGESPNLERVEKLWPVLVGTLENIVEVEPHYLVEGDALLPRGVAELRERHYPQVRACFLGYPCLTPEQKLRDIRRYSSGVNDWIEDHTDEYILGLAREMVEFSRYLEAECREHGLLFFDVSERFADQVAAACRYLSEGE